AGPALRLEEKRNCSTVRELFRRVFFACTSGDAAGVVSSSRRLDALCCHLATEIVNPGRIRTLFARCSTLDTARIPHPSVHIPLRTEEPFGKTIALHYSRRTSRLSK